MRLDLSEKLMRSSRHGAGGSLLWIGYPVAETTTGTQIGKGRYEDECQSLYAVLKC